MAILNVPKNAEFDDGKIARGTDVRANDFAIRDFINTNQIDGVDNINKASDFLDWTGKHSWITQNGMKIPAVAPTQARAIGLKGGATGPLSIHDGTNAYSYVRGVAGSSGPFFTVDNNTANQATTLRASYTANIPIKGDYLFLVTGRMYFIAGAANSTSTTISLRDSVSGTTFASLVIAYSQADAYSKIIPFFISETFTMATTGFHTIGLYVAHTTSTAITTRDTEVDSIKNYLLFDRT